MSRLYHDVAGREFFLYTLIDGSDDFKSRRLDITFSHGRLHAFVGRRDSRYGECGTVTRIQNDTLGPCITSAQEHDTRRADRYGSMGRPFQKQRGAIRVWEADCGRVHSGRRVPVPNRRRNGNAHLGLATDQPGSDLPNCARPGRDLNLGFFG